MFQIHEVTERNEWGLITQSHSVLLFDADTLEMTEAKLNRHRDANPGDYYISIGGREERSGYIHLPRVTEDGKLAFTPAALAATGSPA